MGLGNELDTSITLDEEITGAETGKLKEGIALPQKYKFFDMLLNRGIDKFQLSINSAQTNIHVV